MLLHGEDNKYLTKAYDYKIDKEDAEKLLPILKEYLSKGEYITFSRHENVFDATSESSLKDVQNDCIIEVTQNRDFSDKEKKFLKRKLKNKYDFDISIAVWGFEKKYFFASTLIEILKTYYSVEELQNLCKNHSSFVEQYLKQKESSNYYSFSFSSCFQSFDDMDIEKFIKICGLLKNDSELLDAFLDKYPDIKILKQMAPYLKLVPKESGPGILMKDMLSIAQKNITDFIPSMDQMIWINEYENAILNKKILDALNIKFKSIESKEKQRPEITEKQRAEYATKVKKLEAEYGDYIHLVHALAIINKKNPLDASFFAELEKFDKIPNSIKIKIFEGINNKEFFEDYNGILKYFDYFENHDWYENQLAVYYRCLNPLLKNSRDRRKKKEEEGIKFSDEEKYFDLLDVNKELKLEEKVNMYKKIIESAKLDESNEIFNYVDDCDTLQNTSKNLSKKPNKN